MSLKEMLDEIASATGATIESSSAVSIKHCCKDMEQRMDLIVKWVQSELAAPSPQDARELMSWLLVAVIDRVCLCCGNNLQIESSNPEAIKAMHKS